MTSIKQWLEDNNYVLLKENMEPVNESEYELYDLDCRRMAKKIDYDINHPPKPYKTPGAEHVYEYVGPPAKRNFDKRDMDDFFREYFPVS